MLVTASRAENPASKRVPPVAKVSVHEQWREKARVSTDSDRPTFRAYHTDKPRRRTFLSAFLCLYIARWLGPWEYETEGGSGGRVADGKGAHTGKVKNDRREKHVRFAKSVGVYWVKGPCWRLVGRCRVDHAQRRRVVAGERQAISSFQGGDRAGCVRIEIRMIVKK